MKKYMLPFMIVIFLAGCTKPPTFHPPVQPCNCKLLTIVDTVSDFTFTHQYDAQGRLEYRTSNYNFLASAPDFKVFYDTHGRVSHYITGGGSYAIGTGYWEWHQLTYDNHGNIAIDTMVTDGVISATGPEYPQYQLVFEYTYDTAHRLIKITYHDPVYVGDITRATTGYKTTSGYETIFEYDAAGNLVTDVAGVSVTYDNKVNWNRTDPFLQFINRDYSKNNPVGMSAYNKYGLPLEYPYTGEKAWTLTIGILAFFNPVFTYDCR